LEVDDLHGLWGKILYVDLSSEKILQKSLNREMLDKFMGGSGLGVRLLYDEVKSKTGPFDIENKLIFAPGLFTGLGIPTASKSCFYSKSPLTLGLGMAVVGARLGVNLKRAGYDALIIGGKADKPSILWITNDKVELIRTPDLWGLNTLEARAGIKKKLGEDKISTAIIGPAGENLVFYACIECDDRQAGRTGLGAVMGSKLLKGIVALGNGGVETADPKKLRELNAKWAKRIRADLGAQTQIRIGTGAFQHLMNKFLGVLPTRNWRESYFEDAFLESGGEYGSIDPNYWVPKYVIRNTACPSCNKPCGKLFKIDDGKYKGTMTDGPEFEAQFALGSQCGISNIEAVAHANMLCDLYGLDVISTGVSIGWAMECYEKGNLKVDKNGIKLNFGNENAMIELIKNIAFKHGELGLILSEGVLRASKRIGKGTDKFSMHVKGLEMPAYDVRGLKGLGLSFAVSTRGACHLRSCLYTAELYGTWWKFQGVDRLSAKHKGHIVKLHEDFTTVYDILGICKFSRSIFQLDGIPEIFHSVTGRNVSISELILAGERTYNLQKAFNVREGWERSMDTLPYRMLNEPIINGNSKGNFISQLEFERMLDDYYTARGWSLEGIPTKAKLVFLDLDDIVDEIGV
jgi:aldehyde:ferredoxin oxidoreductase